MRINDVMWPWVRNAARVVVLSIYFKFIVSLSTTSFLVGLSTYTLGSTVTVKVTAGVSISVCFVVLTALFIMHSYCVNWWYQTMNKIAQYKLSNLAILTLAEVGIAFAKGSTSETVVILCAIALPLLFFLGIYAPNELLYIYLLQSTALSVVLIVDRFQSDDRVGLYVPLCLFGSVLGVGTTRRLVGFMGEEYLYVVAAQALAGGE